jgi:hypothetical protein
VCMCVRLMCGPRVLPGQGCGAIRARARARARTCVRGSCARIRMRVHDLRDATRVRPLNARPHALHPSALRTCARVRACGGACGKVLMRPMRAAVRIASIPTEPSDPQLQVNIPRACARTCACACGPCVSVCVHACNSVNTVRFKTNYGGTLARGSKPSVTSISQRKQCVCARVRACAFVRVCVRIRACVRVH